MARTETEADCLVFMGSRTKSGGYGQVSGTGGTRDNPVPPLRAHVVVWEHHNGPIPEPPPGKRHVVRHTCDNPPCVNIAHLELGTDLENMHDMHDRGRGYIPTGKKVGTIPPEVVAVIRAAASGAEASRLTGYSHTHCCEIRKGRFYA